MADGEFNLATLWVPVVPETSKVGPAMEEAGKQAKGSFREGVKDFGQTIHDDLAKVGSKAKDTFSGVGKDITDVFKKAGKDSADNFTKEIEDGAEKGGEEAGKKAGSKLKDGFKNAVSAGGDLGRYMAEMVGPEVGRELGNRVESAVGGGLKRAFGDSDLGKQVSDFGGKAAGGLASFWVSELQQKITATKDTVNATKKAFADLGSGDSARGIAGLSEGLSKAEGFAKTLGIDISDLPGPLQDVVSKTSEFKGDIEAASGLLAALPGVLGTAGAALSEFAAPLALALGGGYLIGKDIQGILSIPHSFSSPIQGPPVVQTPAPQMPMPGAPQPAAPPPGAPPGVQYDARPGSLDPFAGLLPPGMAPPPGAAPGAPAPLAPLDVPDGAPRPAMPTPPPPPGPAPAPVHIPDPAPTPSVAPSSSSSGSAASSFNPSISSHRDLRAAGSRLSNLYALAQSLVGTPYSQPLRNDCSGMVAKLANAALGLPPEASFSTVNEGSWLASHGFHVDEGPAPAGSFQVGWYDHGGGNLGHTAATLPGGEHAESGGSHGNFLVGPGAAGADNPEFEHHAWLAMDGTSRSPRTSAGTSQMPVGTEHDPLYVTTTGGDSSGGGGSELESQGQQLGQGLLSGLMQSIGLDGSVFKGFGGGKSPLDFGITKLGTGLLNWGMGMSQHGGGGLAADLGGGDSGGGGMMPGLGSLIPALSPGARISAGAVPSAHGTSGGAAPGPTTIINGDVNSGLSVTQHGVQNGIQDWQHAYNGRVPVVSNAGGGPLP